MNKYVRQGLEGFWSGLKKLLFYWLVMLIVFIVFSVVMSIFFPGAWQLILHWVEKASVYLPKAWQIVFLVFIGHFVFNFSCIVSGLLMRFLFKTNSELFIPTFVIGSVAVYTVVANHSVQMFASRLASFFV